MNPSTQKTRRAKSSQPVTERFPGKRSWRMESVRTIAATSDPERDLAAVLSEMLERLRAAMRNEQVRSGGSWRLTVVYNEPPNGRR